jgi:four helix bundle protein
VTSEEIQKKTSGANFRRFKQTTIGTRREKEVENREKPRLCKDLTFWRKGMALAKFVYKMSRRFPVDERYGLISQIHKAAVSLPSNIADRPARHTRKEFLQFPSHAQRLLAEAETQLLLSLNLGPANQGGTAPSLKKVDELQKMIVSLKRKEVDSPLAACYSLLLAVRY